MAAIHRRKPQQLSRGSSSSDTSWGGGGRCTHVVHARNRMTMDFRTPKMPGQSTPSCHRSDGHCLQQRAKRREVFIELQENRGHPATYEPLVRRTSILAYGWQRRKKFSCFLVWPPSCRLRSQVRPASFIWLNRSFGGFLGGTRFI